MSAVPALPCCGAWLCRELGLSEICFQVSAVQGESSMLQAERKSKILHLLAQHSHLREQSLLPWDGRRSVRNAGAEPASPSSQAALLLKVTLL